MFRIIKRSKKTRARLAVLSTAHGTIRTPFFMPVATQGALKALTTEEVKKMGAQILLANTYHLFLRPGARIIQKAGGLHCFMNWEGPVLTDSGGFQVFSLAGKNNASFFDHASRAFPQPFQVKNKARGGVYYRDKIRSSNLVSITENGIVFRSYVDGSKHFFSPKKVLAFQQKIGVDIAMVLDVCTPHPAAREQAKKDVELTLKWARKIKKEISAHKSGEPMSGKRTLVFSIVQGSTYKDLRLFCARELSGMDWDGYAVGGLAVGESNEAMYAVLDYTVPELSCHKPRYLMGVGKPENIIEAVKRGIDMFDCVIPTRNARHGQLYLWKHGRDIRGDFYAATSITNKKFQTDFSPINQFSKFPELRGCTKAYLHHLFRVREPLSLRLATLNNVEFYVTLMERIRQGIKDNTF